MRRPLGLALVGLGSFLLALAPLMRFYVAENAVVLPLNYYVRQTMEAPNASYFDLATQKVRKDVTMAVTTTVRGDTRAAANNRRIAVWDSMSEIYDKDRKKQIEFQSYRIAFDRRSAELVNCCGTHVNGDTKVQMSGYGLVWPVANVDKRDYPFFDITTERPLPMRFNGEERVQGINTYRFVQVVPKYKVANIDYKLPGSLLGYGKKTDLFRVERFFAATITVWVDPRTGMPVKRRQSIKATVETAGGKGSLTVAQADLTTVDADQKRFVADANGNAFKIRLVESIVPWSALGAGLVLLLAGALMSLRGGNGTAAAPKGPNGSSGGTGRRARRAVPEQPAQPDQERPEPTPVAAGASARAGSARPRGRGTKTRSDVPARVRHSRKH